MAISTISARPADTRNLTIFAMVFALVLAFAWSQRGADVKTEWVLGATSLALPANSSLAFDMSQNALSSAPTAFGSSRKTGLRSAPTTWSSRFEVRSSARWDLDARYVA